MDEGEKINGYRESRHSSFTGWAGSTLNSWRSRHTDNTWNTSVTFITLTTLQPFHTVDISPAVCYTWLTRQIHRPVPT